MLRFILAQVIRFDKYVLCLSSRNLVFILKHVELCRAMSTNLPHRLNFAQIYCIPISGCYTSIILLKSTENRRNDMEKYQDYSKEELLEHIKLLEKTIHLQHETINRMLDAYILSSSEPKES